MLRKLVAFAVAGGCGACSVTVPDLDVNEYVRIRDVLHTVECDLGEAVRAYQQHYPWILDWAASVTLIMEVEEKGEGDGDASLVVPVSAATLNIGLSAKNKRTGTIETSVQVSFNLDALEPCVERPDDPAAPVYIPGDFGLKAWLRPTVVELQAAYERPESFTYEYRFEVVRNASFDPKFSSIAVGDAKLGAGLTIAGTRTARNKLKIVAKQRADTDTERGEREVSPATQQLLQQQQIISGVETLQRGTD